MLILYDYAMIVMMMLCYDRIRLIIMLCYVTICHDMLLDMINLSLCLLTCDFNMLYGFCE